MDKQELKQSVFEQLKESGRKLRDDIWTADDLDIVADRAEDLVSLEFKAKDTDDDSKRAEYQRAAKLVVDHIQMLALRRVETTKDYILDALKEYLWQVIIPAIAAYLPTLFKQIGAGSTVDT